MLCYACAYAMLMLMLVLRRFAGLKLAQVGVKLASSWLKLASSWAQVGSRWLMLAPSGFQDGSIKTRGKISPYRMITITLNTMLSFLLLWDGIRCPLQIRNNHNLWFFFNIKSMSDNICLHSFSLPTVGSSILF